MWLWALAAAMGAGAYLIDRAGKVAEQSGVIAPDSQTNVPEAKGTIGQNVDKLGTAASASLLLIAGAVAYSVLRDK